MGKCSASEKLKKFTVTVDSVNTLIVEYPEFQPAQEMKARVKIYIIDFNDDWRLGISKRSLLKCYIK